ncbi:MerR family DNA-binding transcriptional regulator [Trinickia mobilis]|uniref:MerR family DNA-binding transcriptional regulator n=1 Tax=Trinickia mobilis TaxID=2816356 RepID=UPI001A8E1959|nr:MerR family DNA-binding transcriptional regulator [Trinickia mobilis]
MLISELARETGLSRETVRFYVRLGLLLPQTTEKGGRQVYAEPAGRFAVIHGSRAVALRVRRPAGDKGSSGTRLAILDRRCMRRRFAYRPSF